MSSNRSPLISSLTRGFGIPANSKRGFLATGAQNPPASPRIQTLHRNFRAVSILILACLTADVLGSHSPVQAEEANAAPLSPFGIGAINNYTVLSRL
ncbi:MAG: hypothetical protein WC003_12710 [Terrimicrobiaceae bacterium]